jgi:hypothetical protein
MATASALSFSNSLKGSTHPCAAPFSNPFKPDNQLHHTTTSLLDRIYRTVANALDLLVDAVGIKVA